MAEFAHTFSMFVLDCLSLLWHVVWPQTDFQIILSHMVLSCLNISPSSHNDPFQIEFNEFHQSELTLCLDFVVFGEKVLNPRETIFPRVVRLKNSAELYRRNILGSIFPIVVLLHLSGLLVSGGRTFDKLW